MVVLACRKASQNPDIFVMYNLCSIEKTFNFGTVACPEPFKGSQLQMYSDIVEGPKSC